MASLLLSPNHSFLALVKPVGPCVCLDLSPQPFGPFTSAVWTFHLSQTLPSCHHSHAVSLRFLVAAWKFIMSVFLASFFPGSPSILHQLTWRFQIFIWKPSLHHSVTNQSSFSGLVSCRHFSPNAIQVAFEFFVLISWFSWKSPQDSGALVWLLTSSNLGLLSLLLQSG